MAGPNMDQFEAYFRKADFDGDGRISGPEAVAFFQGSNLPKQVLAQIWMYADQTKTGFLGRPEFYNALRLVTVAQSKRDLTPDIVKAALYGPAAAKIPAPQINLAAISAPPPSSIPAAAASASASAPVPQQMGPVAPPSQNFGFRGPGLPNANINQNYFPQQNQSVRPPQPMPTSTSSVVAPNVLNSSISNVWLGGRTGAPTNGPRGINPSMPSPAARPQPLVSASSQPTVNDSKALVVSANGFASSSGFGGDVFSATSSLPKEDSSRSMHSASSASASVAVVPVSSVPQSSSRSSSLNSLQDAFSVQPAVSQFQQLQSPLNPNQQAAPASSSLTSSGTSVGVGTSVPGNSQFPWPKMKPSDVQKYTKVFMEVDTDRDGRITGEQARNLFLSWRLPREVLKQVWDLSDQDNDSMLSLREFCFALYLMERFREGRSLPAALPNNILFDETLLSMTGQPRANYGNAAWSPSPGNGFGQQRQGIPVPQPGPHPMGPNINLRPTTQASAPRPDGAQSNQQNSRAPEFGDLFLDQRDNGHHSSAVSKPQEPAAAGKKVEEPKRVILDSKEKIEFYRTKMQELVLYKSRCDNKLNEITERASADKRERLTRFDSINSSRDFGHNPLARFDSISSSRDFGQNRETLTRFDSISSTKDFGHSSAFSFDDTDPFGSSGPFKVSSESQTPKKSSDHWSAF
ncbi:Parvalbumin [Trema orientale]|uniref:Parvalbumin n=1 Tax=Trema orientale TaxID=63057 RepID=A0A2P5EY71_TREOI|nr:Parvalbumin [Trema orientale]